MHVFLQQFHFKAVLHRNRIYLFFPQTQITCIFETCRMTTIFLTSIQYYTLYTKVYNYILIYYYMYTYYRRLIITLRSMYDNEPAI